MHFDNISTLVIYYYQNYTNYLFKINKNNWSTRQKMSSNLTLNESYPPPQLKDFHIEKRLGTGTYATVYKAVCKKNSEVSAIKCIKKNGLNKTSTENLLREIKILKQIKHDYIVQLKDFQVFSCRFKAS